MSQKNVEVVRRIYDLMNQSFRDRVFPEEEARDILDPKGRLDVSRNVFNPGVHKGLSGLRRMFDGVLDSWEEFELTPKEFVEGRERVAVRLEMRARGRDGVEVTREVGTLFTFRDARVVEYVGGMDWAEALEAAGLRE